MNPGIHFRPLLFHRLTYNSSYYRIVGQHLSESFGEDINMELGSDKTHQPVAGS
jgi:hypothetical protein